MICLAIREASLSTVTREPRISTVSPFRERDPLFREIRGRAHVNFDRILFGLHHEVCAAQATLAATTGPRDDFETFDRAFDCGLGLHVLHRRPLPSRTRRLGKCERHADEHYCADIRQPLQM